MFDFGILHHVPDWRRAVREVVRVLKPGRRFYAEEVMRAVIVNPVVRHVLAHPQRDRFDRFEFTHELRAVGFEPIASEGLGGVFAWFVGKRHAAA